MPHRFVYNPRSGWGGRFFQGFDNSAGLCVCPGYRFPGFAGHTRSLDPHRIPGESRRLIHSRSEIIPVTRMST